MTNAQQQNSTTERLADLHSTGRELENPIEASAVRQWLIDILEYAHAEGMLGVEGAWRLDSRYSRLLTQRTGDTPAGGWAGLAGLASGIGVLKAKREGFEAQMSVCELAEWTESDARHHLIESFTERLVPPATAAGLFILLQIHPAWGLRLAHAAQYDAQDRGHKTPTLSTPGGWTDETLFPELGVAAGQEAVFGAIAALVGVLRSLEPEKRYDIGELAKMVGTICSRVRELVEERIELPDGGLGLFLGESPQGGAANYRTLDFCVTDLLDGWLVPAGVAQRFNDNTFAVRTYELEGVSIGGMPQEDADGWFRAILGALN